MSCSRRDTQEDMFYCYYSSLLLICKYSKYISLIRLPELLSALQFVTYSTFVSVVLREIRAFTGCVFYSETKHAFECFLSLDGWMSLRKKIFFIFVFLFLFDLILIFYLTLFYSFYICFTRLLTLPCDYSIAFLNSFVSKMILSCFTLTFADLFIYLCISTKYTGV